MLLRYTFCLPGTATAINEDEKKQMIFKTFPDNWKKQYIRSGKDLATDTLAGMVQFMCNKKSFVDTDDKKRKAKDQGKPDAKKQKKGNYKNNSLPYQLREMYRNTPYNDPCPRQHGPSHTCGQCC